MIMMMRFFIRTLLLLMMEIFISVSVFIGQLARRLVVVGALSYTYMGILYVDDV